MRATPGRISSGGGFGLGSRIGGLTGNRWLTLLAMTGALSMIMLDQTVVTVALPSMTRDLGLSSSGQQWVVNAYVLAMAACVALGGKLGDRFGPVTCFRVGVVTFFIASVLCGLAPGGGGEVWILAARAAQGVGAALMMPVSAKIVMDAFPIQERGRAMAVYAGVSQIFLAVGPLIGGALTEWISWRAVFWLNVPVGVIALILVAVARPADRRDRTEKVSISAAAMLVTGLLLTVLAIQQGSTWHWGSPATLVPLALGIIITTAFIVTQWRSATPLVAVRLLARRAFGANLITLGLVQFSLLAAILFSTLYLQDLLHMSPMTAGLASLPLILPITVAAQLGGRWYDRRGNRPPVLTGLAIATLGMICWTISLPHLDYAWQVPGMIITGFGLGLVFSPTNTDALSRVTSAERGQASGIVQTVRQLGGTLGVAVIGSIVLGVEHQVTRTPIPQHAADAITVGFWVATAVFALALVCAAALLSKERITDQTEPALAPAA
ncbi:MFS transporter [Gordonia insulae]|uniref:Multidrug resistance protein Stp n=1 Tax=Gordonia insulae TaxID=2420509 RepID=A0A3G8JNC4_9ACTN|nr:MFS transporter [Gordonia insulae]AZG46493.1 Multidrug resistance protein Stp [Gordonia insulae]